MARGYFSKLNPRRMASSKRPKPLGESRQRVPRVGGRAALVASSAARFERMEAKAHALYGKIIQDGRYHERGTYVLDFNDEEGTISLLGECREDGTWNVFEPESASHK